MSWVREVEKLGEFTDKDRQIAFESLLMNRCKGRLPFLIYTSNGTTEEAIRGQRADGTLNFYWETGRAQIKVTGEQARDIWRRSFPGFTSI